MKRPSASGIPRLVSAAKAVATRQRFIGALPLAQMPRLVAQLADKSGSVDVSLEAGKDGAGLAWLTGTITGVLPLTCQRGLHPFTWPCHVDTRLRLVASESEEERAMQEAEAVLVPNDELALREVVEDELLLALPMMPRCDDPDCLKRLGKN
jgi:uncharacterized protein